VIAEVGRLAVGEPVVVVCTSRERSFDGNPFPMVPPVELRPLADADARALLARHDHRLDDAQREHVLRCAAGNPLVISELPNALGTTPDVVADIHLRRMPLTPALQASFAQGFGDLAPSARDAVLVVAISDESDVNELVAATRVLSGDDQLGVEIFD